MQTTQKNNGIFELYKHHGRYNKFVHNGKTYDRIAVGIGNTPFLSLLTADEQKHINCIVDIVAKDKGNYTYFTVSYINVKTANIENTIIVATRDNTAIDIDDISIIENNGKHQYIIANSGGVYNAISVIPTGVCYPRIVLHSNFKQYYIDNVVRVHLTRRTTHYTYDIIHIGTDDNGKPTVKTVSVNSYLVP